MSDFDKEAEREKLREKYERDKAEREATQRMSDLLLKGATMTNAHCGTCGDPLFKENGVTFCPSCHGNAEAVQGTDLEAQPAEDPAAGDSPEADPADATGASDRDDPAEAAAASDASSSGDEPDRQGSRSPSPSRDESADASSTGSASGTDREPDAADVSPATAEAARRRTETAQSLGASSRTDDESSRREPSRSRRSRGARATGSADGDLGDARDSLREALERFAAEAAATDDPRYAKECLEAAREAGETLRTLR